MIKSEEKNISCHTGAPDFRSPAKGRYLQLVSSEVLTAEELNRLRAVAPAAYGRAVPDRPCATDPPAS